MSLNTSSQSLTCITTLPAFLTPDDAWCQLIGRDHRILSANCNVDHRLFSHQKLLISSCSISQECYRELHERNARHCWNRQGNTLLSMDTYVDYLTDAALFNTRWDVVLLQFWVSSPCMAYHFQISSRNARDTARPGFQRILRDQHFAGMSKSDGTSLLQLFHDLSIVLELRRASFWS